MPNCVVLIVTSLTAERPNRLLTSDERVGRVGSIARKKDMGGVDFKKDLTMGIAQFQPSEPMVLLQMVLSLEQPGLTHFPSVSSAAVSYPVGRGL